MEEASSRTLHCVSFILIIVLKVFVSVTFESSSFWEKSLRQKKIFRKTFIFQDEFVLRALDQVLALDYATSQAISEAGLSFSLSLFLSSRLPPSLQLSHTAAWYLRSSFFCSCSPCLYLTGLVLPQDLCSLGPVVARSSVNHTVKKRSQCYVLMSDSSVSSGFIAFLQLVFHTREFNREYFKLTIFPDEWRLEHSQEVFCQIRQTIDLQPHFISSEKKFHLSPNLKFNNRKYSYYHFGNSFIYFVVLR